MRKSKIIVLSLIVICVLWFATFAVYFLLLKDNFAEPRNEETEAAVLQAAGFVKKWTSRCANREYAIPDANRHSAVESG